MKIELDCVPCFVRQAFEAVQQVVDDPEQREQMLREVLRELSAVPWTGTPPAMAQKLHRRIRDALGGIDPYLQIKKEMNQAAMILMPSMREALAAQANQFEASIRLAIGGNLLDAGAKTGISAAELPAQIQTLWQRPLIGCSDDLLKRAEQADSILYLADNAGEIFFDKFLIEALPAGKVTVAVRGSPILNDATYDDAQAAGLLAVAELIDNGSDAPGTVLSDCSADFQERFAAADLIISKGQGNYETLSEVSREVFFLFVVKCPAVGAQVAAPLGSLVAKHHLGQQLADGDRGGKQ